MDRAININSEESSHYFYAHTEFSNINSCSDISIENQDINSPIILEENFPFIQELNFIGLKSPQFFQICLANHKHQHKIQFQILSNDISSDCDIFIHASPKQPSKYSWDWKSDNNGYDEITLATYLNEYIKGNMGGFLIGIYLKSLGIPSDNNKKQSCKLIINILNIENEELIPE
jgi:hypothetical protein